MLLQEHVCLFIDNRTLRAKSTFFVYPMDKMLCKGEIKYGDTIRKYLILGFINVVCWTVLAYLLFYPNPKKDVSSFPDLTNLSLEQSKNALADFNYESIYIESDLEKDTIVKTEPRAYSFTRKGDKILLFLSTGYITKEYESYERQLLKHALPYFSELENTYEIKIICHYESNNDAPDGYILTQTPKSGKINKGDEVSLRIVRNENSTQMPDFIGQKLDTVVDFCNTYNLNCTYDFVYTIFPPDDIVSQSVNENEIVYPNCGVISFIVSKGLMDIPDWSFEDFIDLSEKRKKYVL